MLHLIYNTGTLFQKVVLKCGFQFQFNYQPTKCLRYFTVFVYIAFPSSVRSVDVLHPRYSLYLLCYQRWRMYQVLCSFPFWSLTMTIHTAQKFYFRRLYVLQYAGTGIVRPSFRYQVLFCFLVAVVLNHIPSCICLLYSFNTIGFITYITTKKMKCSRLL